MFLYLWHLHWVPERCGVGDRPFPKHSHFQRTRGASERVASTEGKGSRETLENNWVCEPGKGFMKVYHFCTEEY